MSKEKKVMFIILAICAVVLTLIAVCADSSSGGSYEQLMLFDGLTPHTLAHTSTSCSTIYTSDTLALKGPPDAILLLGRMLAFDSLMATRYHDDSSDFRVRYYNSLDGEEYVEVGASDLDSAAMMDTTLLNCIPADTVVTPYGRFWFAEHILWSNDSSDVADSVTDTTWLKAYIEGLDY